MKSGHVRSYVFYDQQMRKRVFHIFHSWHGDFVDLMLVLACPYELIVCKRQTENGSSQRILCPQESVCPTDFYLVPSFSHWSTNMLNCFRLIFTESLNLFLCFDTLSSLHTFHRNKNVHIYTYIYIYIYIYIYKLLLLLLLLLIQAFHMSLNWLLFPLFSLHSKSPQVSWVLLNILADL